MRQSRIAVFAGVVLLLGTVPARGTIQRTFVSRSGSDTNACTIDLPCRSFAAAILQTSANGEIVVNDSAGYGAVTITQAVAIVSPLGVHAGISVFSGDGVTVNAASTDVVGLRNLYINSQGGVHGITLTSAAALRIEHCTVSGFSGHNINLVPTVSAAVEISDTVTRQSANFGIYADSAQPLTVSIDHCRADLNGFGVLADRATVAIGNTTADKNSFVAFYARGTGGTASMAVEASVVSNNLVGVQVDAGNASVHDSTALQNHHGYVAGGNLAVDHSVASGGFNGVFIVGGDVSVTGCTIADNSGSGVRDSGGVARMAANTITRNSTGITITGGGTVNSTGDNMVDGNTTNVSGTITPANKV